MKTRAQHRAARRASVVGRPSRRLLAVLLVVLVTAGTTWFSGASFTSSSFTWATVGAAADYHPPTVAVTSPGGTVSGTVTVQATASDSASGVASVRLEHAAVGSASWTTLCTDTTAPYSCPWSTTLVADGDYRLRALATDVAGFSAPPAEVTTRVANPASVTLTTVPDIVRGTVPLSATITGAGNRSVSSAFQHRVDGATTWTTIIGCSAVAGTAPSCSWATGTLADLYDVRVVSTVGTGASAQTVSAEQLDVVVDNLAPTVSITSPSGTMSGTVQVVAVPLDEDSGVERVELSYKLATASTYTPLCTVSTDPYRCALNTTSLTNLASYDLRAIAYDEAGNVTTAAGVDYLADKGANIIKIGQGPGSICTTRLVAGVGIPQMTALYVASQVAKARGVSLLADGGITKSGDIVKALTLADGVICGGLLAGCPETPGQVMEISGKLYKQYRGMGSLAAMKSGSAARYGHAPRDANRKVAAEGIEALKEVSENLDQLLAQLIGGVQAGMGYLGAATLPDLRAKARYTRISPAGQKEAAPHDVAEMKASS